MKKNPTLSWHSNLTYVSWRVIWMQTTKFLAFKPKQRHDWKYMYYISAHSDGRIITFWIKVFKTMVDAKLWFSDLILWIFKNIVTPKQCYICIPRLKSFKVIIKIQCITTLLQTSFLFWNEVILSKCQPLFLNVATV